jgi:hypothetical protein
MMQLIEIPSSKRSSSEARLLLREYSHRINNEFASAIGAISVARRTPPIMRQRPCSPLFRISCKITRKCATPCNYQETAV